MPNLKYPLLLILSVFLVNSFSGCTRVIDIEPLSDPMISLKGWWSLDREMILHVTNTQPFGAPDIPIRFLDQAQVNVWENDSLLGAMVPDSSDFFPRDPKHWFILPDTRPKAGKTYRIEAQSPGLPDVQVETTVPSPPKLLAIRFIERSYVYNNDFDSLSPFQTSRNIIEVDIQDEPGVENFYDFVWVGVTSDENGRPMGIYRDEVDVLDPQLLDESGLITDRTFADGVGTIRFSMDSHFWSSKAKVEVELGNVPMEYVYLKRESPELEPLENPLVEPIGQFSNVIGGVGSIIVIPTVTDSILVEI